MFVEAVQQKAFISLRLRDLTVCSVFYDKTPRSLALGFSRTVYRGDSVEIIHVLIQVSSMAVSLIIFVSFSNGLATRVHHYKVSTNRPCANAPTETCTLKISGS